MKLVLFVFMLAMVSCGKSAMDAPATVSQSLSAPVSTEASKETLCLSKCTRTKSGCDVVTSKYTWEPGKSLSQNKCEIRDRECKEYCKKCEEAAWSESTYLETVSLGRRCTDVAQGPRVCSYDRPGKKVYCSNNAYELPEEINNDFYN